MSLRSMTGHGQGTASASGILVSVEISSVNRKQLDVSIGLPRSLGALEPRVQEEVQKWLSRGRVTGEVNVQLSPAARREAVCVDAELAGAYLRELRSAAKRLHLTDDFQGSALLSLPDVVRFEQPAASSDVAWPLVEKALKQALARLLKMREREGKALQKDMARRLTWISSVVTRIRRVAPAVSTRYAEKLRARLREAGFLAETGDERLLKEVALFADRSDVTEEMTRLESHIAQAHKMMESSEPVGRSLDFLVQEMFRETNTIGSKANDGDVVKEVVELKAELERIREQVQNIE
ncbi:MAG TPA: YicC family protein [Kiritimatiellia bacterium]|nr:YicC family protein [Kiritimatiellia bacterium]